MPIIIEKYFIIKWRIIKKYINPHIRELIIKLSGFRLADAAAVADTSIVGEKSATAARGGEIDRIALRN